MKLKEPLKKLIREIIEKEKLKKFLKGLKKGERNE